MRPQRHQRDINTCLIRIAAYQKQLRTVECQEVRDSLEDRLRDLRKRLLHLRCDTPILDDAGRIRAQRVNGEQ